VAYLSFALGLDDLLMFLLAASCVVAPEQAVICFRAVDSRDELVLSVLSASRFRVSCQAKMQFTTGHFWSLSVEEQFYFAWPGLLVLPGRRNAAWFAGWCCRVLPVADGVL
jgi:peptidoglycan/LPS O-acetylase OafA/YrhL